MEEIMKIESVNPEILYQTDKAAVDSQVATAKKYPRNIRNAVEGAMAIVTLTEKIASTCSYALTRDGKTITGASVHLARIIAREWENMRIGSRVVAVNEKDVVCEGYCWDLEKNIAVQVSVKRGITNHLGQRYSQDMIILTGNAGNAIAMRNAIFSVIPKSIIDTLYDAAIATITGDLTSEEKLIAKRVQVLKNLVEVYGITEMEILSSIGKQSKEHIGAEEIAILIGMDQAIKDGDSTVKESFQSSRRKKGKKEHLQMARTIELKVFKDHAEKIKTITEINALRARNESDPDKVEICDQVYAFLSKAEKPKPKRKTAPKAKPKAKPKKKPVAKIQIEK